MKYLNLTIIFSLLLLPAIAQVHEEEVKVDLSNPTQNGLLKIHIHNGQIHVSGHDESFVLVKFKNYQNKEEDKHRGTLKKISNAAMNIDIVEYNNTIEIDGSNDHTDYQIHVPYDFNLNISSHHNSDIVVKEVNGIMEIQGHHGSIQLHEVGGSVSADTHHGSISGSFKSVDAANPMAFSTYHGDIEIVFPDNLECNTKMKSDQGDIYTDFELSVKPMKAQKLNESGHREIKKGGWLYGSIGNGGKEYMFTSYHGDIILRKP